MIKFPPSKSTLSFSLITVYLVGIVGLSIPQTSSFFAQLTPLNLIYTLTLILLAQNKLGMRFWLGLSFVFIAGMMVEIIGVETGFPFGAYHYTDLLGPSIVGVPWMLGVNWVIVILCTWAIACRLTNNMWIASFIGAGLTVLLDLLIEPFAINYGLWVWDAGLPPMQNYLGWFASAFIMLLVFNIITGKVRNSIAELSYLVMTFFFGALLLIPKAIEAFT